VITLAKSDSRTRADERQQPTLGMRRGLSTLGHAGVPPVPAARLLLILQRSGAGVRKDASAPQMTGLHDRLGFGALRCVRLFSGPGNHRKKVQGRLAAAQDPSAISNRYTPKILSAIFKQNRRMEC